VRTGTPQHIQTQDPNACAAIQDERRIRCREFDAGSVAAENGSSMSGCGDRPSRPPETYAHYFILFYHGVGRHDVLNLRVFPDQKTIRKSL